MGSSRTFRSFVTRHCGSPAFWRRVIGLFGLIVFAPLLYAPISEEAAQNDFERMLWHKKKMQEKSPEQVRREIQQMREEHNRRIREAMARPPIHFKHYMEPQNPLARRWIKHWLQQTTADKAGVKQPAMHKRRGISMVSSLIALAIFAALFLFHITRPKTEQ